MSSSSELPAMAAPAQPPALPGYGAATTAEPAPARPPVGRFVLAGVLIIALFFGGFGAWAALAPLASASLAQGVVRAESSRKTVQHLEGGIIKDLLVKENTPVRQGQVLIRLDATAAESRYDAVRHQRDLLVASQARLLAQQAGADRILFPDELEARRGDPRTGSMLATQEKVFATRRQTYTGQREILETRIGQLGSQIEGLNAQIAAADEQLALLRKEETTVRELVRKGLEREPRLLDLQRRGAALGGARAESQAEIARAQQAIGETRLHILALDDEQSEKTAAELKDVQSDLAKAEEEMTAAEDVLRRREIVAPIDGTVVNMKFVTQGGVVNPGTPILDIVPSNEQLLIEAQINPMDIDVVHPGMLAEVRLTAFKQRRMPVLDGELLELSADRFTDERNGYPYYKALVVVDAGELATLDDGVHLYPGMPMDVMLKTGDRTFLEYLVQPVVDSFHKAFRED